MFSVIVLNRRLCIFIIPLWWAASQYWSSVSFLLLPCPPLVTLRCSSKSTWLRPEDELVNFWLKWSSSGVLETSRGIPLKIRCGFCLWEILPTIPHGSIGLSTVWTVPVPLARSFSFWFCGRTLPLAKTKFSSIRRMISPQVIDGTKIDSDEQATVIKNGKISLNASRDCKVYFVEWKE